MTKVELISFILSSLSIIATVVLSLLAIRLSKRQGEIIDRLNDLQTATAETQLREKITVMKQRIKKFKHKPHDSDKYDEDEVVLLIGDCQAALPLFEYAPPKTRKVFVETTCEAMASLDSQYIDDRERHKQKLRRALIEQRDSQYQENRPEGILYKKDKPQIAAQFDAILEGCGINTRELGSLKP